MAIRRAARHAPHQPSYYYPAPPLPYQEPPRQSNTVATVCTLLITLAALLAAGALAWRAGGGQWPTLPTLPTRAAVAPVKERVNNPAVATPIPGLAQNEAEANAAYQTAVAKAEAPAVPAPALPSVPTAFIAIPTALPVELVTVVPIDAPLVVAPGSDVRATLAPTMVYPTPLPAAVAEQYQLSPDGKCITAPRAGKMYQVCQEWKYAPAEIATVADLIRGGTLAGVEVTQ